MTTDHGATFTTLIAQELALAAARHRPRLWNKDLAAAMGVTVQHFSRVLNGHRGDITTSQLSRACALVGADPEQIVARAYARLIDELGAPPATPAQSAGTAPSRTSALSTAATRARAKRSSKGTRDSSSG